MKNIESVEVLDFSSEDAPTIIEKIIKVIINTSGLFVFIHLLFNGTNDDGIFFLILIIIIALNNSSGFSFIRKKENIYQGFAKRNGLDYFDNTFSVIPENLFPSFLGTFTFSSGHNRRINNLVTFNLYGKAIYLFDYQFETGVGKTKNNHYMTIIAIGTNANLPKIMLSPHESIFTKDIRNIFAPQFENMINVHLDGRLEDKCNLIAQRGHQIEALQVFTPDFIEVYEERFSDIRLELANDKSYIIHDGRIFNRKYFKPMIELAEYMIKEIIPKISKITTKMDKER